MKLKKLIKDIPDILVKGSKDIEITGIAANSKFASPGNLFVAKKGFVDDGSLYVGEALDAGATAILSDMYNPSLKNVTQLIHKNVTGIEGLLAAQYYQFPSRDLFMVGLTGTNGKTTTSFLIKYLFDRYEGAAGLIGTIEYIIGPNRYQATRTTPDVITNHKMLREMLIHGCKSAVMEVTSHALDQGRVQNIEFDVALFTNLTVDHLDYHETMENYLKSKNRLFKELKEDKTAIINLDSPYAAKILEGCRARVFTYGIETEADLKASHIQLTSLYSCFELTYLGQKISCRIPLIGRFNVYNCLAALSVGLTKGISFKDLSSLIETLPAVPGRLEPVPNALGFKVYIDFAHSGDALFNVLDTLKEVKTRRILTVFGCGGDRDKSKRAEMAAAAEKLSDICIITSDNPRSEDPMDICQQVAQYFKKQNLPYVEPDRRKAIALALQLAEKEDIILIAGKGHETYQIFAHKTIEFDDRKVVLELLSRQTETA